MSNNKINIQLDLEAKPTPRVIRIIRGIANVLEGETGEVDFTPAGTLQQTPKPARKRRTPKKAQEEKAEPPKTRKELVDQDDDKLEEAAAKAEKVEKQRSEAAEEQKKQILDNMKAGVSSGVHSSDTSTINPKQQAEANKQEVKDPEIVEPEKGKSVTKPKTHKQYTIDEVRAVMQHKARKGHKATIKEKFIDFGKANGLTSMDAEYYPAFMEFLEGLAE